MAPRCFSTHRRSTPFEDQWAFLGSIRPSSRPDAAQAMAAGFGELAMGPDASTFRRASNID